MTYLDGLKETSFYFVLIVIALGVIEIIRIAGGFGTPRTITFTTQMIINVFAIITILVFLNAWHYIFKQ